MAYLIDTSLLARLANSADAFYPVAVRAVLQLHRRGETLHVTPQHLIEFRSVATRPIALNGLGLTPHDAEAKAARFEAAFPLLLETPDIYRSWKTLVDAMAVVGKHVHDARLVAVCHVYEVTHLWTFNLAHFARLAGFGPGIAVVAPDAV